MVNINQVASAAYGAMQKLGADSVGPADGVNKASSGGSFADLLAGSIEKSIGVQKQAEQLSSDAALGKADINEVILAVQNADVVLNTVVAVRDKVVSAYQDILRMSI